MGFERKPDTIMKNIIESQGSEEATEQLRRAGKKGATARAVNRENRDTIKEYNEEKLWKEYYTTELAQLRDVYPEKNDEGEYVDEEWYEAKAIEYADAMIELKKRMQG